MKCRIIKANGGGLKDSQIINATPTRVKKLRDDRTFELWLIKEYQKGAFEYYALPNSIKPFVVSEYLKLLE